MTAGFLKRVNSTIDSAEVKINKFKESFDKDPSYALSWSLEAFQAAATLKIAKQIKDALETGTTVKDVREHLTSRIMHKARWPAQSTSPTSNLTEQYEAAAMAEFLAESQYYE